MTIHVVRDDTIPIQHSTAQHNTYRVTQQQSGHRWVPGDSEHANKQSNNSTPIVIVLCYQNKTKSGPERTVNRKNSVAIQAGQQTRCSLLPKAYSLARKLLSPPVRTPVRPSYDMLFFSPKQANKGIWYSTVLR